MIKKNNRSGLTLLEVVIASILLVAVAYLIFQIMVSSTDAYEEGTITGDLEERSLGFITAYETEFGFAKVASIDDANHNFMVIQIPVDGYPGDPTLDDILDAGGNIEFGINSPVAPMGPQLDWSLRLVWVPDRILRETNGPAVAIAGVPEEVVDFSLNRDQDLDDTLVEGTVFKEFYDDTGALVEQVVFCKNVMLAPRAGGGPLVLDGDVNGDGEDDRLFDVADNTGTPVLSAEIAVSGAGMVIRVWLGKFGALQKSFHLRTAEKIFIFRNK